MLTSELDYELPEALIAQRPADPRDSSRLMVIDAKVGTIAHHVFRDLPRFLRPGDALVLNETKVLPARVSARRPGGGEVELLFLRDLGGKCPVYVIEGDQATDHDARRIRAAGGRVVQINTGAGCHLDAAMVARALDQLDPPPGSILFIENVGNLVCPALFDLGERAKVVVCSVPEGDDKPAKYPHMFRASSLMVLNKTDLLPHVPFEVDRCLGFARQVNPGLHVIPLSAMRGTGLDDWYAWLRGQSA